MYYTNVLYTQINPTWISLFSKLYWLFISIIFGPAAFQVVAAYEFLGLPKPNSEKYFRLPSLIWLIVTLAFYVALWYSYFNLSEVQSFVTNNEFFMSQEWIPENIKKMEWLDHVVLLVSFGAIVGSNLGLSGFAKHLAYLKGVTCPTYRWLWWFQTMIFGIGSVKNIINYDPVKKSN